MCSLARSTIAGLAFFSACQIALSQTANDPTASVRVTMSVSEDGSRTIYKFNDAEHTATATARGPDGKLRQKIRYQLDDVGRFATALVFGADGKLRFKSRYKYDGSGKLEEETQLNNADVIQHRIVYNYDSTGRASGYSIFDADGKLMNRVAPIIPAASRSASPRGKR